MWDVIRRNVDPGTVRLTEPADEFVKSRVTLANIESRSLEDDAEKATNEVIPHSEQLDIGNQIATNKDCAQFAQALQSFEESLSDKHKTRFNLRELHTWDGVIREATIAQMTYNKKAGRVQTFWGVNGLFQTLLSNSSAMENWLDLLPSGSVYGSLICGGFKIILRAATRMDEIKQFIIKAMADIPEEIAKAKLLIEYNEGQDPNQRLYNSISTLYRVVFDILDSIIRWYRESSIRRKTKVLFQQSSYESELQAKGETFKNAIEAVKDEANICGQMRLQTMDKSVQNIEKMVRTRHVEEFERLEKQQLEMREFMEKTLKYLTEFCRSSPMYRDPKHDRYWQELPDDELRHPGRRKPPISRKTLCAVVLRYEKSLPWNDLATILHYQSDLDLVAQDTIMYIIQNEALKTWLLDPKNAALLVRGLSEHSLQDVSPISFFAAHFIQSIPSTTNTSRFIGLFWFAKQHQDTRTDEDANVHGVIRSLIGQLLHAYGRFDLYFVKKRHGESIIGDNDLETLCDIFDNLILQLPRKKVTICVIDWLACLEYDEQENVAYLLKRLMSIIRHPNESGSLFKLLVTHTGGAFRGAEVFEKSGTILDVPEGGDGSRMGFSQLMWQDEVDDKLEHLGRRSKK
ncbi:hypothetical protein GGR57DRAFT_470459 [Xylariaceae sp. FL1272]|nr:hypothetical protein GGR57DRAFT_470459 [Xylariaceae sp. FL1272]